MTKLGEAPKKALLAALALAFASMAVRTKIAPFADEEEFVNFHFGFIEADMEKLADPDEATATVVRHAIDRAANEANKLGKLFDHVTPQAYADALWSELNSPGERYAAGEAADLTSEASDSSVGSVSEETSTESDSATEVSSSSEKAPFVEPTITEVSTEGKSEEVAQTDSQASSSDSPVEATTTSDTAESHAQF